MYKFNAGAEIRDRVIENLLRAHERITDNGEVRDVVRLSKFILKLSNHFEHNILNFGMEARDNGADNPPEKGMEP